MRAPLGEGPNVSNRAGNQESEWCSGSRGILGLRPGVGSAIRFLGRLTATRVRHGEGPTETGRAILVRTVPGSLSGRATPRVPSLSNSRSRCSQDLHSPPLRASITPPVRHRSGLEKREGTGHCSRLRNRKSWGHPAGSVREATACGSCRLSLSLMAKGRGLASQGQDSLPPPWVGGCNDIGEPGRDPQLGQGPAAR